MDITAQQATIIQQLKELFGEHLTCVCAYHKNTKWCIVVEELMFDDLVTLADMIKQFTHVPLIITMTELVKSKDVFCLEYLSIKQDHTLMYGKDVFKDMTFKAPDVRRQLEFEFRSKLINLRETFMHVAKSKPDLDFFVEKSLPTLMPLFIGILRLKNIVVPVSEPEIFNILAMKYKLNVEVLHNIYKGGKFNPLQQKNNIRDLIILLEDLVELVDQGKL